MSLLSRGGPPPSLRNRLPYLAGTCAYATRATRARASASRSPRHSSPLRWHLAEIFAEIYSPRSRHLPRDPSRALSIAAAGGLCAHATWRRRRVRTAPPAPPQAPRRIRALIADGIRRALACGGDPLTRQVEPPVPPPMPAARGLSRGTWPPAAAILTRGGGLASFAAPPSPPLPDPSPHAPHHFHHLK